MATIILTGGGTAGHCIPNVALLPYLKNDFSKIYYFGSKDGIEKEIIENQEIPYYEIPCAKLDRSFKFKNLFIPFSVISGISKAGKLLDKLSPDIVFSKGGYVSVPTVIAAHKRKIPVIAHESDYTVGLANKITSRYCKKVLTSFPETAKTLKNGEYVGPPLKRSLFTPVDKKQILQNFGLTGNKPILLVTGGSQGAKPINQALIKSLPALLPKYEIIHICGKGNLNKEIKRKGYFQTEFSNKIENAFKVASVCITRAGSNTLFELISLKVPCILIPLSNNATRGDQILNAEYFQKLGVVNVLPQNVLTAESLVLAVNSTYSNRQNLIKNMEKHPVKDACRQISRIIADYLP